MGDLSLEEFAESLGLPTVPHVKFIPGSKLKQAKNAPHPQHLSSDDEHVKQSGNKTRHDRMFERRNQTVLTKHYEELHAAGNTAFKVDNDDNGDDLLTKKRKIDWETADIPTQTVPVIPEVSILIA